MKVRMKPFPALWFAALLVGVLWRSPALAAPIEGGANPIKVAVLPSQGTQFPSMTIWRELNAGWSGYGDTPVAIDYQTLGTGPLTLERLNATDADVVIISTLGVDYLDPVAQVVTNYVQSGHGLIVTYASVGTFDQFLPPGSRRNQDLLPLLGMSEQLTVGGNTWPDGIAFDLLVPDHPILAGIDDRYMTGVPFMVSPVPPTDWELTTGVALARANPSVPGFTSFTGNGLIVANETDTYRSVYFPHYIEDKSSGSNQQDMQVFYNTILWTSGVPEPSTACLLGTAIVGAWLAWRFRRQPIRRCRS